MGDFNALRKNSERRGLNFRGSTATREVKGFNNFIESVELLDVPLIGGRYTWYKDNGTIKSRIYRILISSKWLKYWLDSKQYIKGGLVYDHCALLHKPVIID